MQGIGSVLVEAGPSLDYYTGIQWWRSERLTGVVIPARGDPIIVTPFFEQPTIKEMLAVPAEIRTWQEDEDPLRLVADFLRERKVAAAPVAFEETNRFFLADRLKARLPRVPIVSGNPVVQAQRMIKSPAELALMQAAADIMAAALRYAGERTREGMTAAEIDAMIAAAHKAMGSSYDGGLVLIGEASAYPHGSRQRHVVKPGEVVLLDCTCAVHGYQADISRSYVIGEPPAEVRKVWEQMRRGQDIAFAAAKVGAHAEARRCGRRTTKWAMPALPTAGHVAPHRPWHRHEVHEPINLVMARRPRCTACAFPTNRGSTCRASSESGWRIAFT